MGSVYAGVPSFMQRRRSAHDRGRQNDNDERFEIEECPDERPRRRQRYRPGPSGSTYFVIRRGDGSNGSIG